MNLVILSGGLEERYLMDMGGKSNVGVKNHMDCIYVKLATKN